MAEEQTKIVLSLWFDVPAGETVEMVQIFNPQVAAYIGTAKVRKLEAKSWETRSSIFIPIPPPPCQPQK